MLDFKKYIKSIISGIMISLVIYLAIVFYQIGAPTESSHQFDLVYRTTTNIAQSFSQPKLVVVAGSNAAFGVRCQLIYEEMGIACVNGGTHAGLGIDYLLYKARRWIKPGDIVLLPLEYNHYVADGKPTDLLIDYVFSHDSDYFYATDFGLKARLTLGMSFVRLAKGVMAKIKPLIPAEADALSQNRNRYGDFILNQASEITSEQRDKLNKFPPLSIIKGSFSSTYGTNVIRAFVEWCKANQVKVIATYPNTIYFPEYEQEMQSNFFISIQTFYQELGVPLLGHPQDFMYGTSNFFDTNYHLNDRGCQERTQQLIHLLRPYL